MADGMTRRGAGKPIRRLLYHWVVVGVGCYQWTWNGTDEFGMHFGGTAWTTC